MGRHGVAHLMSPLAHRLHHLRRHLQLARHALLLGVQHTAGDHQLHQIHALLPSLLQLGQCLVDGVGRHRHRPGHVAAGNGDALIGRQDAGSHPPSGPNIVPQPGIEVRQTAHRADGGDAGEQLLLGKARHHAVGHLPGQSRGEDGLYQLLVVPLLFLRLAAARQMDVHIDEPRHQIAALQVHHLIARQIRPLRYDVRNAVAVGPQHQSLTGLHLPCAVQQLATTKCVFHRSPRPFLFLSSVFCPLCLSFYGSFTVQYKLHRPVCQSFCRENPGKPGAGGPEPMLQASCLTGRLSRRGQHILQEDTVSLRRVCHQHIGKLMIPTQS